MVAPSIVSRTCTGPRWVDATEPVTLEELAEPDEPVELPGLLPEMAETSGLVAMVEEVEVW